MTVTLSRRVPIGSPRRLATPSTSTVDGALEQKVKELAEEPTSELERYGRKAEQATTVGTT